MRSTKARRLLPGLMFIVDPQEDAGGTPPPSTPPAGDADEKKFSQADVNKAINERIARERSKFAGFEDLKAKAARLDELEEAQKTEQQKQADALAVAQKAAAAAAAETVRYKAAAAHGIGPDDFNLIGSGDEADVMARAERVGQLIAAERELAELKESRNPPPPPTSRPRPGLRPGAAPVEDTGRPASADAAREAALRRGRIYETSQ